MSATASKRSIELRIARTAIATALGAGLLTGCAMAPAGQPARIADRAQTAISKGDAARAVSLAEQAVRADPTKADYRTMLGNAYLRAGRFASARQAYDEAMRLGDDQGRTALSMALADIAQGNSVHALDTLNTYRDAIPASDYGLAVALAGQPRQGVAILANALRSGENTAKMRQNLAYAFALDGQWAQARVMAAMDVPADKIDARITQWARFNRPEDTQKRVAMLLGAPVVGDPGERQALALANTPSTAQLADEAAARAATNAPQLAAAAQQELPPVERSAEPAPSVEVAQQAPAAPAPAPVAVHTAPAELAALDLPASEVAPAPAPASAAAPASTIASPARPYRVAYAPRPAERAPARSEPQAAPVGGTHLVQLGAFSSAAGADRAWQHFARRNPGLKTYRHEVTHVVVNGHDYWRVMVGGLNGYASASSLCHRVKTRGGACFVRADAVHGPAQPETRMARR